MLSSGISWKVSHNDESPVFHGEHTSLLASVYTGTKENTNDKWDITWCTKGIHYVTSLYHAIEIQWPKQSVGHAHGCIF